MPFKKGNSEYKSSRPDVSRRNSEIKTLEGHAQNIWIRFDSKESVQLLKSALKGKIVSREDIKKIRRILNEKEIPISEIEYPLSIQE